MCGSFFALLKKDFRLMVSSKFFLLAIGSLILYTCYINFVYVKLDQEIFPVYLYDPAQTQNNVPDNLIPVSSLKELQNACEDGYSIGIDLSDGTVKIMMTSCGISKIDNLRHSYAVSKLSSESAKEALIIGPNNKDMKSRREITAEFLFFELSAPAADKIGAKGGLFRISRHAVQGKTNGCCPGTCNSSSWEKCFYLIKTHTNPIC